MNLIGEDLLHDGPLKALLFPHARNQVDDLARSADGIERGDPLVAAATVTAAAAACAFADAGQARAGASLLRQLAGLLEAGRLETIPWGPTHPANDRVRAELAEAAPGPAIDPDDGADGMFSLMRLLEAELGEALDALVERFEGRAPHAQPDVLYGFLVAALFRKFGQHEDRAGAWVVIREAALDQGFLPEALVGAC